MGRGQRCVGLGLEPLAWAVQAGHLCNHATHMVSSLQLMLLLVLQLLLLM